MPSIFKCFKDGFSCRKKKKTDKVSAAASSSPETVPLTASSASENATSPAEDGKVTSNGPIKPTLDTLEPKTGTQSPKASPKLNGHAKINIDLKSEEDETKAEPEPEPEPEVKTTIPEGFKVEQEFLRKFLEFNKSGVTELQLFNKLLDEFSPKGLISISQVLTGPGHQPAHRTTIELGPPEGAAFVGNSSRKIDSKTKAAKEMLDWLKEQSLDVPEGPAGAINGEKKASGAQAKPLEVIEVTDVYTAYKSASQDSSLSKGELLDKLAEVGAAYLRLETIKKPAGARVVLVNEGHTFVATEGMSVKPKELLGKMLFPLLGQGKTQNGGKSAPNLDKLIKLFKAASNPPKEAANLIQALKDKSPTDIKILAHTSGPSHEPIHYTEVLLVVPDIRFKAAAKNKAESKALASKEAVNYLTTISLTKVPAAGVKSAKSFKAGAGHVTHTNGENGGQATTTNGRRKSSTSEANGTESSALSSKTSQAVYEAVHKRWKELAVNLAEETGDFESIAAFVGVSSRDPNNPQVLSLATGSSWPLAETFPGTGKVLLDSHAPVVARRALLTLLYENLLKLLENQCRDKTEFILQKSGKGFRLKSHLKLYLYTSVPPSGGAASAEAGPNADKLYAKLAAEQGTFQMVPVDSVPAEKLKVMSTSDKIASWNLLGVQGSLLSAFIEPIYLDGLIISEGAGPERLRRSLVERIDEKILEGKLSGMAGSFRLNNLSVGVYKPANHESALGKTAPSTYISHNWYASLTNRGRKLELVNSQQGTVYNSNRESSRLSKYKLAKRFVQLTSGQGVQGSRKLSCGLIGTQLEVQDGAAAAPPKAPSGSYRALKDKAVHYNRAKGALVETLQVSGLGTWSKLGNTVDLFTLD